MSRGDHIAASGFGRLFRGQTAIDFYGRRRIGLIVGIIVVLVTVASLFTRGLDLGLEFQGGDAWEVPASQEFGVDEAVDVLEANSVSTEGGRIQERSSVGTDDDRVSIEVRTVPEGLLDDRGNPVTADLAAAAGVEPNEVNFSFTSSTWGSEITNAAVRALVIFLALVALFISLRFEWRMAFAALAAMAHDVVLTVGVYSLFQFLVTPATVIAFLTILGYSLYDTIVVFDRIRENEGRYAGVRIPYEDIVNISMNQVLMRSLNTSISSILPVISLLLIGAGLLGATTLRDFATALLVGMLSGVYSSIFVAAPLLALLKSKAGKPTFRTRLSGDELRAAVIGLGVSARVVHEDETKAAEMDLGDDAERTAAVTTSSERLLSHPPRPRKKRRR
jgi:preprotein translocase subunit SecF